MLLTLDEARQRLRISRASLYRLCGEGALPLRKIGGRSLIAEADIQQFIDGLPPTLTPTARRVRKNAASV